MTTSLFSTLWSVKATKKQWVLTWSRYPSRITCCSMKAILSNAIPSCFPTSRTGRLLLKFSNRKGLALESPTQKGKIYCIWQQYTEGNKHFSKDWRKRLTMNWQTNTVTLLCTILAERGRQRWLRHCLQEKLQKWLIIFICTPSIWPSNHPNTKQFNYSKVKYNQSRWSLG